MSNTRKRRRTRLIHEVIERTYEEPVDDDDVAAERPNADGGGPTADDGSGENTLSRGVGD